MYSSSSASSTVTINTDLLLPPHALCRITVLQVAELEVTGTGTAAGVTLADECSMTSAVVTAVMLALLQHCLTSKQCNPLVVQAYKSCSLAVTTVCVANKVIMESTELHTHVYLVWNVYRNNTFCVRSVVSQPAL
jgi:hypothetical protein